VTVGTAAKYLPIINSMSEAEVASEIVNPRELLLDRYLYKSTRLEIAYAPFDYINTRAKIVIVGITPGKQQMQKAIEEARKADEAWTALTQRYLRAQKRVLVSRGQ
jgi:hypothetical protein